MEKVLVDGPKSSSPAPFCVDGSLDTAKYAITVAVTITKADKNLDFLDFFSHDDDCQFYAMRQWDWYSLCCVL